MFKNLCKLRREIDIAYRAYLARGLFGSLDDIIDSEPYITKTRFAIGYIKDKRMHKKELKRRTCPLCKRVYDTEEQAKKCEEACKSMCHGVWF